LPLLVVVVLGFRSDSVAQSSPAAPHLRGVKEVTILVEPFQSSACGLNVDDVTTSVSFILGQSAIKIGNNASIIIYVNVNNMDNCLTSNVTLEVLAPVTVLGTNTFVTNATIWDVQELMTGGNQRSRILETVEELCKRLVVDWNSVNKAR
jgi:hypothetical protein